MEELHNPVVSLFGIDFDLTILAMSILTVAIIFSLVFWASRKMTLKPTGKQNVLEWLYEFIIALIKPSLGSYTKNYTFFAFCLFLYILVSNNLGLMSKIDAGHYSLWTSPTANFAVDFGLAVIVALVIHVEAIRKRGIKGYLKGYLDPVPAMLPLNILGDITNVLSLSLRLFGNIYAGEVVLSLVITFSQINGFTAPIAFILNLVWTAFSVFISSVQAYVFVLLATTYIGDKLQVED